MRHIKIGAILVVVSAAYLAAQVDPPGRVARLNYRDGAVSFQPNGISEWVEADVNRPLTVGDNIWVGDRGRAEFHIGSAALRLSAYSAFQFLNLDDQTVQIRLSEGTLTVRLRNLDRNQIFEIDTPNLAFTLERPGVYRVDVNPDSLMTTVTVRDGEGQVTGGGESFPVYSRQRVVVRGDDQINYNFASAVRDDDFDQWCSGRDRREDQSVSARYVSREIPGYDDFDEYGRWDNQPGYGQVWMPNSVSANWAPYHDGHWAWIAPWGWTWVDDAPWGFAPYHYGRWANFSGRWGWVPGPYGVTPLYSPALVGWIGGGRGGSGFSLSFSFGNSAAIGWFPLGPREPYFPSYQVSQGYFARVNTTNTVINTTIINNYYNDSRNSNFAAPSNIRYANQRIQNGITAVSQNTFASGRRVTQEARFVAPSQVASAPVINTPPIAPQRGSVLGARADTVSRAARPPADVQNRRVVARRAPPAAPVSFDRQQAALARNPGRPLAQNEVQQIRQSAPAPIAPVRVVDMNRVQRVDPSARGQQPQAAPQQGNVSQPERRNIPPGQMQRQVPDQQQQQVERRPQDGRRQDQQQPRNIPPQPPVTERQNAPSGRQLPEIAPAQRPPEMPRSERQNGPPGQQRREEIRQQEGAQRLQQQKQQEAQRAQQQQQETQRMQQQQEAQRIQQQQQEARRQQQQMESQRQERQRQAERQQQQEERRQQQKQNAPRQPEAVQAPAEPQEPPTAERQQRPDRGKKQRE